ncbi:MAG: nucleotidyltransferase [Solirubrobacterales bacterium]|nr:nucleotidyltransferase [Solirubrobacterales bacterium]
MAQLPDAFDIFYGRISLNKRPCDKIESAASGLITYLSAEYGVSQDRVFLQGSYPNGTAVEPEDKDRGEYDVDLVCDGIDPGWTATAALDDLEEKLATHGTYEKLLRGADSRKKPCVRLFYAEDEIGAFHVDVVPARPSQSSDLHAPLEVPRRESGWHDTAPREYTVWCRDRGGRFARTVRMLKRWRDHSQDTRKSIKSIVLQVLAAQHLGGQSSDAAALVGTLVAIQGALAPDPDTAPSVENPVLRSEDLAARWDDSAYRDFRKHLANAVDLAQRGLHESDERTSHDLWRHLLGPDFPEYRLQESGIDAGVLPATPPPGHHRTQAVPRRNEYGL